jgi:predicted Zn-dependent protease with MMP-like domain
MREREPPVLRVVLAALAASCLSLAVVSLFVTGFSSDPLLRALQSLAVFAAGVALLGAVVVAALVRIGAWKDPVSEREFEALVERAERLAAGGWDAAPEAEDEDEDAERFEELVSAALDELELEFHRALEHVAIVISDRGREALGGRGAYGLYEGDTIARDYFHERITIFRDTLLRDFGDDPELLRAQVARTLRHELAHHLGWGEKGVRGLGL